MAEDAVPGRPRRPIFDAATYTPDTIDFRTDLEARKYWLQCFPSLISKFAAQAACDSDTAPSDAAVRAEAYRLEYVQWINTFPSRSDGTIIESESGANQVSAGKLQENNNTVNVDAAFSIRTLLERSEPLLRQHGFADPWREVKHAENQHALDQLAGRLVELDRLREASDSAAHWTELFRGLFAGNVFDWGAQAVTQIREQYAGERAAFGLHEALGYIQARPWLIDDLDRWLERVDRSAHRCAAVFVDNSGADIVLGVLPFVRELLRRGTRVILCANREPSLNDITCAELRVLLVECGERCSELKQAMAGGRLLVADNGQSGPCLDMRQLSDGEFCYSDPR